MKEAQYGGTDRRYGRLPVYFGIAAVALFAALADCFFRSLVFFGLRGEPRFWSDPQWRLIYVVWVDGAFSVYLLFAVVLAGTMRSDLRQVEYNVFYFFLLSFGLFALGNFTVIFHGEVRILIAVIDALGLIAGALLAVSLRKTGKTFFWIQILIDLFLCYSLILAVSPIPFLSR